MLNLAVRILANYLIVQTSIILFMLPFGLVYWYRHVKSSSDKLTLSRHLENFFLSKQANYLVFFWALGEALVWFVIPEFLLLLIVFMRIHRKKELLVYDVSGTVIGTTIAYFIHFSNNTIAHLPYIQKNMVAQTLAWYGRKGILGLLYQPFSGVPYKVFTLTANHYHFSLIIFVAFAILVRMSRYFIFFGLFIALYPGLHKYVYRNYVRLFIVVVFIFSVLLLKVYDSYGPNRQINFVEPKISLVRPATHNSDSLLV